MRGCFSVLRDSKHREESEIFRLRLLRVIAQNGGQAPASVLRDEVACRSTHPNQFDGSLNRLVRDEFVDHDTFFNGRRLYKITEAGTAALSAAIAEKKVPPLRPLVR